MVDCEDFPQSGFWLAAQLNLDRVALATDLKTPSGT
jgi:hypothetical protein